ncbi:MAG: hypothetical protein DMG58_01370 [Acidobacteria bacterium]|nr:MAG: hypothetical protein DMG58_01370 [Acidobacteriota bacterium]
MPKATVRSILWLLLIMILFYWKILLTRQFSLLTESEGVNQAYSWYHFWIASLRQGVLPLWDPYMSAGRSFVGEMQTAAFYPLNFLLVSFHRDGALSPQLYHEFFVLAHFLGACFMFALVRELGLSRFSALVAGICFSLAGFVARMGWPHMLESSIWLPLIFLFLLRACKAGTMRQALLRACLSGLSLGMAILAGGLHIVMMQALVIVSAVAFYAFHSRSKPNGFPETGRRWIWAVLVTAMIAGAGVTAGAIQLLPSMEYSRHAFRFLGNAMLPAAEKIPYAYESDGALPHSFTTLFLFAAFNGNVAAGEYWNPYAGDFPLLLAAIGVWKKWGEPWVRYFTGLAVAAFLYSLGSYSLLHGLLYALIPFLWMGREAARYSYLISFAVAILAAFGAETLFSESAPATSWSGLNRILKWLLIACAAALAVPAVFGRPEISPWSSFGILMIFASYGLFRYIVRGHAGGFVRFLAVALILFDLHAFEWTVRNKIEAARTGTDQLERLLSCSGAVAFLKSQPGIFRVQVLADPAPNIGDIFGIQTLGGGGVTLPINYKRLTDHAPRFVDLLNVRYFLKPASSPEPGPLYQDSAWKIYENAQAYPRAWVVHDSETEPSPEKLVSRLGAPGVDLRRVALLAAPLDVRRPEAGLEPLQNGAPEEVTVQRYQPNKLEIGVRARSRGILVLSELFYPGWRASVNGRPARIYEVDGALRGVVVNAGESHVALAYAPGWLTAGAVLTLAAFGGTLLGCVLLGRKAM